MAYQPKSYRKFIAGAATAAVVAGSFAGVAGAASFSDTDNNTHKEAILALVDKGIIKGYPDGTFRPYASITRGDAAVMVARTLGILDGKNIPAAGYPDLNQVNKTTQEAIAKLSNRGIVSGFGDGTFRPNEPITRSQMAKYIVQAFDLPVGDGITKFTDVNKNAALAPFVDALADAKITLGKNDGTFGYFDNLNRGDFSAMIYRALNVDSKPGDDQKPPKAEKPLSITGDSQGDKIANGKSKLYTVKVVNPVSGKPLEGVKVNVTFEENVGTDFGPARNATVTNAEGHAVIPFQANDGQERAVQVTTDKDGVVTFEVTGSNTSVTPIVFLDGSNQEWDLEDAEKPPRVKDGRFDENTEYYAKAKTLTFAAVAYDITVEGQRTNYAAVALVRNNEIIQNNGREYIITVKNPDGTPFAGGEVNVGIYELLDGKVGNEPSAAFLYRILEDKSEVALQNANATNTQGTIKLGNDGTAKIWVSSLAVNDNAKPYVWIDQNPAQQGKGVYEAGEPVVDHTKVKPTNFQEARIDNLNLGAELKVEDNPVDGYKDFRLNLLNQSGKAFQPFWEVDANVTFTITNKGPNKIEIDTRDAWWSRNHITNSVNADLSRQEVIEIGVGGSLTVSGHIENLNRALFSVDAVDGTSSLDVKASAVISENVDHESRSVTVTAERNGTTIGYSYVLPVTGEAYDTDTTGKYETIVLTYDKAVSGAEAGDFKIGSTKASTVSVDGRKVTLKFTDGAITGAEKLSYDPYGSDKSVLVDEYGNKVKPNGDIAYSLKALVIR